MGSFFFSMHFKADDSQAVLAAADGIVAAADGHMFIAPPAKGWISAYPNDHVMDPDIARKIATKAKVEHSIVLGLMDSDVTEYWYFRNGKLADAFNSCPDYFGKAKKKDLAAVGNSKAFAGLLSKADCTKLAKLIGRRMVNGDYVGRGPAYDFEDERFEKIAGLLKIPSASGWYDDIVRGQSTPGVAAKKAMTAVGKPVGKTAKTGRSSRVLRKGETPTEPGITFHLNAMAFRTDGSGGIVQVNDLQNPPMTVFVSDPKPTRSGGKAGRLSKSGPRSKTK